MANYETYAHYRDQKGLKDFGVAKQLGIRQSTLSDWKNGRYVPKIDKLEMIAELLGITVEQLKGIEHDTKTQIITMPERVLTDEDDILLDAFHHADDLHKAMVLEILGIKKQESNLADAK